MIRIHEIKLNALENKSTLPAKVEKRLHLPSGAVESVSIVKESVDARNKPEVFLVYSLDVCSKLSDNELLLQAKRSGAKCEIPSEYKFEVERKNFSSRPVVVGFGPCGMFAAYVLALAGAKPIILERGPRMDERINAVEEFWKKGALNPNANAQFGEGGAGTFSDGKLTTGTKSEYQCFVLESFVKFGADPDILYKQKPHIGTDVIRKLVVELRKEIEKLGGEFRFNTKLVDVQFSEGKLNSILLESGELIPCEYAILALGHSARDTIRNLFDRGIDMQQKQFSMGLRIEHDQELIDIAQYGISSKKLGLGPADYKMNIRTKSGRGVYSFCMCPGGEIVNASSETGRVVCNGMSNRNRDSGKANSAILVDVRTSDFESAHPLAGIDFQEKYEELAFRLGGSDYSLPSEKLCCFMKNSKLKDCLPQFVYESLKEAIPLFGNKLKGFDNPDAELYAIESRSSSPVRIPRDEQGFALSDNASVDGLYPAGEGAGYAGGIMSAACDGVRAALKIIRRN